MRHLPTLVALVLPGLALATAADGRPVRNSFIDRPVADAADLVRHVRTDPVVADRYERHFAMDRAAVLRFLATLHRSRLARAGTYTIYSVPSDGHLKMHVGTLPKGEPMFVDPSGRPTLIVRCGNPVVLGTGHERKSNRALGLVVNPTPRTLDIAQALSTEDPLTLVPSLDAVVLEPTPADANPSLPTTETVETTSMLVATQGLPSLDGAALLLPIVGAVGLHGAVGEHPHSPQAIPEPGTVFALASGVAVLARRRRK